MISFENWKRRFMACFTRPPRSYEKNPLSRSQQERQDGLLTNWLYWPKGNTPSCSEPPRFVPNLRNLKTIEKRCSNKTKRTP